MQTELDHLLHNYLFNQEDPETNWALAVHYDGIGQTAAALSFYLRTAERTEDKLLQYESLLRGAGCYYKQGARSFTVRGLVQQAITTFPTRPEAYYLLSVVCEQAPNWDGNWFDSYTYASLGLEVADLDLPSKEPLRRNLNYPGVVGMMYQKAHTAWWCGLCEYSRDLFLELYQRDDLDENWRELVRGNLIKLNAFNSKTLTLYNKADKDTLKIAFDGVESIDQNYSEAYQDMFVLTMLNGKKDGTYLEIGAGDPFYGNNTALLEQLGWTGVGIDLDPNFVEAHGKQRSNTCILRDATTINYQTFLEAQGLGTTIDYLQIDVDPADVSLKVLMTIPFETHRFAVVTFEHDHYADPTSNVRARARKYLQAYGYIMVAGNISPDDNRPYEDWFVHPDLVDKSIIDKMNNSELNVIMAKKYMEK